MASARMRLFTCGRLLSRMTAVIGTPRLFTRSLICHANYRRENFQIPKRRNQALLWAGLLSWFGLKEKEEEDVLITTIKRGILCLQRKEYNKAENILHLALKVAQERQDMQGQRYVFDLLANVAFEKGDLEKAEKLFIELTKELLGSGTNMDDNSVVEISLKLASIYSQKNDDVKAEEGFRFCVGSQEKKVKSLNLEDSESLTDTERNDALLWAMSVDWYGKHLLSRGYWKSAVENFQKALAVSEKINGETHPQTLVLINDIGSVSSLQKDYDTAIKYFKKAIELSSKTDDLEDLPSFYCNLGATYFLKGNSEEADKACTQALKLARKIKNSTAETEALECLAEIQNSQKAKST